MPPNTAAAARSNGLLNGLLIVPKHAWLRMLCAACMLLRTPQISGLMLSHIKSFMLCSAQYKELRLLARLLLYCFISQSCPDQSQAFACMLRQDCFLYAVAAANY